MGIDGDLFEEAIKKAKSSKGVKNDTDLEATDLQGLVAEFKDIFRENVDGNKYPELVEGGVVHFPQDPKLQLQLAIQAVFGS